MKEIERNIENRLQKVVELDEMLVGFMPKRGMMDATFITKQLMEKFEVA